MTQLADPLLADLMPEHRPELERTGFRPGAGLQPAAGRRPVPRPVWLAAGAAGVAGAVTAGMIGLGGGSPAYAVTRNPGGTLTVSVNRPDGVPGANAKLRALGSHVVVVPVKAGCPPVYSLAARNPPVRHGKTSGVARAGRGGTVTMDVHGIPAGDIAVVAAESLPGGGMATAVTITKPPAPSCVAPLPVPPAGGSGSVHSGSGGGSGPGTAVSGGGSGS